MDKIYQIHMWSDDIYAVYPAGEDWSGSDYLFKGNIVQVNAWLELVKKGFVL